MYYNLFCMSRVLRKIFYIFTYKIKFLSRFIGIIVDISLSIPYNVLCKYPTRIKVNG